MDVLHITAHMGGGVGKAMADTLIEGRVLDPDVRQRVLYLEPPVETKYIARCEENGILAEAAKQDIGEQIAAADLVVLHWWNHPRMTRLLMQLPPMKMRAALWAHVSGCTYPKLPYELADEMDWIMPTTWYTYETPYWSQAEKEKIRKKSSVVYGLGRLPEPGRRKKEEGGGRDGRPFTVGYVGTIHESKLNPRFLEYCREVKTLIPSAHFLFVGDNRLEQPWEHMTLQMGLSGCIEFTGYVPDAEHFLGRFDAFGYVLNPYHFGTTENALLEAMAMELPVVALNQGTERYLIQDGRTGFLVSGKEEYAACMKRLYDSECLRRELGKNASLYVRKEFDLKRNVQRMHQVFGRLMKKEKQEHHFQRIYGNIPHEWFLHTVGNEEALLRRYMNSGKAEMFCQALPPILKGPSKGSVSHYAKVFPEDAVFKHWNTLL